MAFLRTPSLFKESTTPSPVGRWSMSFGLNWQGLMVGNLTLPFVNATQGAVVSFNPLSYENKFQNLGSMKSIVFSMSGELQKDIVGKGYGNLLIYCPDSGVTHLIGPDLAAAVIQDQNPGGITDIGFVVNGCLPLQIGATTALVLAKQANMDGGMTGQLYATVFNYEIAPYLSTMFTPVIYG